MKGDSMKWQDNFYMELHPYPKLVLNYMYDNCNAAGVIEYHAPLWLTQIQGIVKDKKYPVFTKEDLKNSLGDLKIKLLSDGKKKLFIKDFLKHKKKLPLIKGIEENDWIIEKLASNLEGFGNPKEICDILKNVRDIKDIEKENKKKIKETKRFVVPSFEDFKEYYLKKDPESNISSIHDLYDHYEKVGWKTKGGIKITNYEAAIRGGISRKKELLKSYGNSPNKKSRSESAIDVYEELTTKKNNNA